MARAQHKESGGGAPEGRYAALFNNMAEGFVVGEAIRDAAGHLVDYVIREANPVFLKRTGSGPGLIGRRQSEFRPGAPEAWYAACERALAGEAVRFEFRDRTSGRWYDVHMMRLSETEFGQFFIDVTDRKRAEQRQAELLEELNHRVKNNLAVISSILELQARASAPEVRVELAKAVDRIRSIADLHNTLYHQKNSEEVDLGPYLDELGRRLSTTLFEHGEGEIAVRCDPIHLPVKEAVSLGLIVNELVTNAAKHAFPGRSGGRIEVAAIDGSGQMRLVVADDGRGFDAEDRAAASGLGLRVARSLAEGLGGRLRVLEGPGGRIEVTAPISPAPPNADRQQPLL